MLSKPQMEASCLLTIASMSISRKLRKLIVLGAALAVTMPGVITGSATAAQAEERNPAPSRQSLFFNHAYGVVDRVTADAIEHSTYLRDFSNFSVQTVTGGGQTWTGRYLMGRETYLELFGVGDLPGPDGTLGAGGMGVSVERTGDLATVIQRLHDLGVTDPAIYNQTLDFGDGTPPIPWFDAVFTTDQYDAFGAWGMENRQEYFADPRTRKEAESFPGDVGRERYLNDKYGEKLMRDISGIRLAVTQWDLDNTVPLLRAGGFVVRAFPGGLIALRGGTMIRFDAVPRAQAGLRHVEFVLNQPVSYRHTERIGRSTLVVGPGSRASWSFDPAASDGKAPLSSGSREGGVLGGLVAR
jgi:hypothetical protein